MLTATEILEINSVIFTPATGVSKAATGGISHPQLIKLRFIFPLATKDTSEQETMVAKSRISGNGIRQAISGHRKQTLVERQEVTQLVFLSATKDILVREMMDITKMISGSILNENKIQ